MIPTDITISIVKIVWICFSIFSNIRSKRYLVNTCPLGRCYALELIHALGYTITMKIPGFFKDAVNPTKEELKKWAYGDYYYPVQDFQLFVMNDLALILGFIEDLKCPKNSRDFFLDSLYVWVGDAVRSNYVDKPKLEDILAFLNKEKVVNNAAIQKFISDATYLINNPTTYTYEKWGIGANFPK
jgi:hypothetical protein